MADAGLDLLEEIGSRLRQLGAQNLLRQRRVVDGRQGPLLAIDGRTYLAFASNDYLGLAIHPALLAGARNGLDRFGIGAAASALITGHTSLNEQLETALAEFVDMPRALHFSTGLHGQSRHHPGAGRSCDIIFSDRLNHACIIDGARLSGAEFRI